MTPSNFAAPNTGFVSRAQAWLNLRPGEGRRVAIMVVYSAAAMGGVYTVGVATSTALFLSQLPPSAIPFAFILPALGILPAMLVYNRLAARARPRRVILASNLLLLLVTLGIWLLLTTWQSASFGVLAALHLIIGIAYTLVILQFWAMAAYLFNPREARRLFGLIAAGGTLSSVAAGLALAGLSGRIGVPNLLLLVALALGVCMACVAAVARLPASAPPAGSAPARLPASAPPTGSAPARRRDQRGPAGFREGLAAIGRSPLLVLLGSLTILLSLIINIGAYQFFMGMQSAYAGRGEALAAFLGGYSFVTGLAAFFTQVYLASRLMTRLGVFAALVPFPGLVLAGGLLVLASGGWLAGLVLIRAADPIFRRTLVAAALNVLYLPVPAGLRERGRELFEALYAVTFGLAGLLFLASQFVPGFEYTWWAVPLVVLAGGWLWLLPALRRRYSHALAESLRRRALDLDGAALDFTDEDTLQALGRALDGADEMLVLHALKLAGATPSSSWNARVAGLLEHPSATVRMASLEHLARSGAEEHALAAAALLAAPEPRVRAAAVYAYSALARQACADQVLPLLTEAHPDVRAAAGACLLRHGQGAHDLAAHAALDAMLAHPDPAERAAAARALGSARRPEDAPRLAALLDDESSAVQRAALEAAGALAHPALAPRLLSLLSRKPAAGAAASALAGYGPSLEPLLAEALAGGQPPAVRRRIPRLLQDMSAPRAAAILAQYLAEPDDQVRAAVLAALAGLRAAGAAPALAREPLLAALDDELRRGYALAVARADLTQTPEDPLLTDAFNVRLARCEDNLLHLLICLHPAQAGPLQRVRRGLRAEHGRQRAGAIELLDTLQLPERAIRALLLPLLEAPLARVLQLGSARFGLTTMPGLARLEVLARASDDPWLQSCAIYHLGRLRRTSAAEVIQAQLAAPDALVRESALAACRWLLPPADFRRLLPSHMDDAAGYPNVARLAHACWQPEGAP